MSQVQILLGPPKREVIMTQKTQSTCFYCDGRGYLTEATDPAAIMNAMSGSLNGQKSLSGMLGSLKKNKADFDRTADDAQTYRCNACKGTGTFEIETE